MMRMSDKGLALLTGWEGGAVSKPYPDSTGVLTIGVGHALTRDELSSGRIFIDGVKVPYSSGLTKEQMTQLFRQDVAYVSSVVNIGLGAPFEPDSESEREALIASGSLNYELTQDQFDALVSFAFNVGGSAFFSSTLRKRLVAGKFDEVPTQMRRWIRSKGNVVAGLINRREQEILLFEGKL